MRWPSPGLLAGACFALYLGLGLRGYGNDNDTYLMIQTWNVWREQGRYEPSRGTGYLVPELAIGLSSALGGHVASNALSAALGASVVYLLQRTLLATLASSPAATLAALSLALHPGWAIASSTSMDYVYPICFFAFGVWLLARGRWLASAVPLACAVSSRITFAVAVALACASVARVAHAEGRGVARPAAALGLAGALALLLYLPAYVSAGHSLAFLTFAQGTEYSPVRALGHDLRGQLAFWGFAPLALLLAVAIRHGRELWQWARGRGAGADPRLRLLLLVALSSFAWFEAFYLRLPAEPLYLLPALAPACALLAVCRRFARGRVARAALPIFLVGSLVQSLVGLNVIAMRDDRVRPATALLAEPLALVEVGRPVVMRGDPHVSAHFGLFLEPGEFLQDARLRAEAQRGWTRWLHETWPHHGPGR